MTKMKFKPLLVAALVAAAGFGGVAQANVVDLFTEPAEQTVTITAGEGATTKFSEVGPFVNSILGGYRDIVLTTVSNGFGGASAGAGAGGFNLATGPTVNAIASVQWDGNDNSAALTVDGLGGADLINQTGCPTTGCDRFIADVSFADLTFQYSITIWDMDGNFATLISEAPGGIVTDTFIDFPFEWWNLGAGLQSEDGVDFFIINNGGTVNFSDVGAIEFTVNSNGETVSVDLALGAVTKTGVPEPASIALAGLALLGLGAARRRKQ